jgi:long-chain acyl-CoA synthetase
VYPTDVEQVMYRHPKVRQVCVVGVPDERTGEAVKAFVVLKEGERSSEREILEWTRDEKHGLSGYRAPKKVEFREELPTTMVGKVLRRVLLDEEKQKAGA